MEFTGCIVCCGGCRYGEAKELREIRMGWWGLFGVCRRGKRRHGLSMVVVMVEGSENAAVRALVLRCWLYWPRISDGTEDTLASHAVRKVLPARNLFSMARLKDQLPV